VKNKIVLGTVQFGLDYGINNPDGKPSLKQAHEILDFAKLSGLSELDTADAYGNSSEVLKDYFQIYPKSFRTMSKYIAKENSSFEQAFFESLKRLGLNQLEGYYFHRFDDFINFQDFNLVHQLKKNGLLKSLAVSLYTNTELAIAASHPEVDVIQLPFNVFDRAHEKIKLLKTAKENNKKVYVRSVFLQGLFFMELTDLPPALKALAPALSELHSIANKYSIHIQELCLKYVLGKNFIDKVVIGVDTKAQLEDNLKLSEAPLPSEIEKEVEDIIISRIELLNPSTWNK
jgi:aryl-alcohol dehydrogenase-like predicted oxidoreductase